MIHDEVGDIFAFYFFIFSTDRRQLERLPMDVFEENY